MREQQVNTPSKAKSNIPLVVILFFLLPRFSTQELSERPPGSSSSHSDATGNTGSKTTFEEQALPAIGANFRSSLAAATSRLRHPLEGVTDNNVSLNELADNIGRLEGNLASLIQSFLALQRSVFNLEQLQELLVLLLEDILKETGNMDKSARDMSPKTGSSTASASGGANVIEDDDDNDDIDSAEIDETGEETGDGKGATRQGGHGDGKDGTRSTGNNNNNHDGGRGGGGGDGNGNSGNGQDGTDPFNETPSNIGEKLREVNNIRYPDAGRQQQGRRVVNNRISHDSDEYDSEEEMTSRSAEDDDDFLGGLSTTTDGHGGTNSVAPKTAPSSSNNNNKAPSNRPPGRRPHLSEPMVSLTAQLEARLNDMIQRLNPNGGIGGSFAEHVSPRRLGHIRELPLRGANVDLLPTHHLGGESPLAQPRPIFEPLDVVLKTASGTDKADTKSEPSPASGGVAATTTGFEPQGVKVVQRMPVVSHGGPLVGPEDFSSPFMEMIDTMVGMESQNERSTGMISNMMQLEGPHSNKPNQKSREPTGVTTKSPDGQTFLTHQSKTTTTMTTTTTLDDDFDQMIATLLQDLSEHLREQRGYYHVEDQTKTGQVIDRAVVQLDKLTWIQKTAPADKTSSRPEYKVHIAAMDAPSHPDDSQTTTESQMEGQSGKGNLAKGQADSDSSEADRTLTTRFPSSTKNRLRQGTTTSTTTTVSQEDSLEEPVHKTLRENKPETNLHVPWDWLRYIEKGNVDLHLLVELLTELSSGAHNTSKGLGMFNDRGQKLVKDRIIVQNSNRELGQNLESRDNYGDSGSSNPNQSHESKELNLLEKDLNDSINTSEESQGNDKMNEENSEEMEHIVRGKEQFHHMNSDIESVIDTEYSNSIMNNNETDMYSSESEDTSRDDDSIENVENDDVDDYYEEDDDSDEDNNDENQSTVSPYTTTGADQTQSNAPLRFESTKPTEESYASSPRNDMYDDVLNTLINSILDQKSSDKGRGINMKYSEGYGNQNNEQMIHGDDEETDQSNQSESGEQYSTDNDSNNDDDGDDDDSNNLRYPHSHRERQETQLFGPPHLAGQSTGDMQNDIAELLAENHHTITKRNIKRAMRKFHQPQIRRKKRQADVFWRQFMGQGLSTVQQQQGFPPSHDFSNLGDIFQSQANAQGHTGLQSQTAFQDQNTAFHGQDILQTQTGLQGQRGLQAHAGIHSNNRLEGHTSLQGQTGGVHSQGGLFQNLGGQQPQQQNQRQNSLHQQSLFQMLDHQNQRGATHGQSPFNQFQIPPFRPYPQYSRYNSYLGFNHPQFGYPGYPGYPGMNHEPGESPSFEAGPSADVMEEVLNNLFQRYWENVRNMFTTKGPSTTPEYEYEGPVTTTTTTPPPKVATTTAATQAAPKKGPKSKVTTTLPTVNNVTSTITTPSLMDITNVTFNNINSTTATFNITNNATSLEAANGTSLTTNSTNFTFQVSNEQTTGQTTGVPPDFFQKTALTKTSSFPFF